MRLPKQESITFRGDACVKTTGYRRTMVEDQAALATTSTQTEGRKTTLRRSCGINWSSVCAENGNSVGDAPARNGLRLRYDVLATSRGMARCRRLGEVAHSFVDRTALGRSHRLVARCCGFRVDSCSLRWKKTGPNPTDRAKPGSKHHVLTDAQGIPLTVHLTGANAHDVTELLPLVDSIPSLAGKAGHPKSKPDLVQADRGYDSDPHRAELRQRGITPVIARRRQGHGSGLGKTRWVVERTISWLHQFRRLRIRFEKRSDIHEALLKIGCALICLRFC